MRKKRGEIDRERNLCVEKRTKGASSEGVRREKKNKGKRRSERAYYEKD